MPVEREFTRLRNNSRRIVGPLFLFAVSHPVSYRVVSSLSLPLSNSTLFHPLNYFVSVTLATNGKPSNHVSPSARTVLGLVNTRISIPHNSLFFFFLFFISRTSYSRRTRVLETSFLGHRSFDEAILLEKCCGKA